MDQINRRYFQIKDFLKKILHLPGYLRFNDSDMRENLSPIFVIGANRSGTSIITSIFSQHPELEGLFGHTEQEFDESGHSIGFCESLHIWPKLLPNPLVRKPLGHLPYWALPNYVGFTYRNSLKSKSEAKRLAWRLETSRKTNRVPLLKDQFNTLRIGMIAQILPKARFILCRRSLENFTSRGIHKWANDNSGSSFDPPYASFHWHMVNMIAMYDLEIFFPNQYTVISLDEIHISRANAIAAFKKSTQEVALTPFEFDLSELEKNWNTHKPTSVRDRSLQEDDLADIPNLVRKEREIIAGLSR